jgi:mannosyltransferase
VHGGFDEAATISASTRSVPELWRLLHTVLWTVPERMGFHIVERWQFSFAQVVKSTRSG